MANTLTDDIPDPAETGFADLDDHRIEFMRYAGDETRPALVFLHEGLGSLAMWRDFPARLAAATGATAIVYSRRGYGNSSPRTGAYDVDYMHREALDILPRLLDLWAVGRTVLIGHSDGASIALIHGAEHALDGIAVMAPHVFVEDICIEAIEDARETFAATDLAQRLGRYHADAVHAFRGWNDIWLLPQFRHWNIEEMLGAIAAPVLAIQGRLDPYGTMAQLDRIEAAVKGPFTRVELDDCGHSPQRDKPAQTLAALVKFYDDIATGAPLP